jgi:hypothetical protein
MMGVKDLAGHELPIFVDGVLSYEPCTPQPVGWIEVAKILVNQRCYAAGDVAGAQILTHNPKP